MSEPVDRKKRATYADIESAPPDTIAEIINGELHLSPRPFSPHAAVASSLGMGLGSPFQHGNGGPGGWWILDEPELHLGDDVLVPDLAGWRRERMPVIPEGHPPVVPDWICEVLSESTERIDRMEKMPIYAAYGVQHAWLVKPSTCCIEAYRLVDGRFATNAIYSEHDRARIPPFDAVELDLALLWTGLPLPTRASEGAAAYDW